MPSSPAARRKILMSVAIGAVLLALLLASPLRSRWRADDRADAILLSGNIEAHESVLSFKNIQSRIAELPFNEGQWVRKDTVVAVADAADYAQQLAIAEASLAVQQRQLDAARQSLLTAQSTLLADQADLKQRQRDERRAFELRQQGFVSPAAHDQAATALTQSNAVLARDQSLRATAARNIDVAQASVHSGEATVALAKIMVGYTTLKAPFDGVVTVRQAELGEVVAPGTPVLTMADLEHMWVRAYLNEADLGRIHLGQDVSIGNDSHPGKHYRGRISFISSKAEFTPKSVETHAERVSLVYRVKIDLANPDHDLVPGMPVDVRIDLQPASRR